MICCELQAAGRYQIIDCCEVQAAGRYQITECSQHYKLHLRRLPFREGARTRCKTVTIICNICTFVTCHYNIYFMYIRELS